MNYSELTSSNTNDTSKDIKSYYYRIVFLEKVRKWLPKVLSIISPTSQKTVFRKRVVPDLEVEFLHPKEYNR